MRISSLQLWLIVAGVLLVACVLAYNAWQERRIRRRIDAAFRKTDDVLLESADRSRVEPTFRGAVDSEDGSAPDVPSTAPTLDTRTVPEFAADAEASAWSPPMEVVTHALSQDDAPGPGTAPLQESDGATAMAGTDHPEPDPEIECIVTLQPARPVGAGMLAAGLHARLGKRLRWFGRTTPGAPWRSVRSDTRGEFIEFAACLLLADRNGAASPAQLDTFVRVLTELAPMLPAAMSVPDIAAETARAETLDRLCADVDVQVGLTILKREQGSIPGTRLRGVAEAAGFRLASGGRFEWASDDTGAVLYTLQNVRNEPFTVDTLRLSATHGVVMVLDVPRVAEPARVFDQMKLAAKRMAHTLDGDLVDDNRRPLDDAALTLTRQQVQGAADALRACGVEPGSPRALALFGA